MQLALPLRGYAVPWKMLAVGISIGIALIPWLASLAVPLPPLGQDADAYWNAAMRVRDGAPLYPVLGDPNAADVYRYAPWFAGVWVPLTALPQGPVYAAWIGLCLLSAVACLLPLARYRDPAALVLGLILGFPLLMLAIVGNVQPVLVAAVMYGGRLSTGIAGSLKPSALAFALVDRKGWVSVLVAAALWLPALWFDLSHYPTQGEGLPFGVWAVVVAVLVSVTWRLRDTRYGVLAAAVLAIFALPRVQFGYATWLLVAQDRQQHLRDAGEGVVHGSVPLRGGEVHEGTAAHLSEGA